MWVEALLFTGRYLLHSMVCQPEVSRPARKASHAVLLSRHDKYCAVIGFLFVSL